MKKIPEGFIHLLMVFSFPVLALLIGIVENVFVKAIAVLILSAEIFGLVYILWKK